MTEIKSWEEEWDPDFPEEKDDEQQMQFRLSLTVDEDGGEHDWFLL